MSTGNAWVWLAGRCLLKLSGHVQYSLKHNLTLQTMLHLFYEAGYSLAEQGHIKLDGVRAIWYHPLFWTLQFASPSEVSPLKVILNWSTALCHSYSWHIYKFGHELINILIFLGNITAVSKTEFFFFQIYIHTHISYSFKVVLFSDTPFTYLGAKNSFLGSAQICMLSRFEVNMSAPHGFSTTPAKNKNKSVALYKRYFVLWSF